MNKTLEFLKELTELSRKYNIKVFGCGCCGSPFLLPIEENEKDFKYNDFGGTDSYPYPNIEWGK